MLFFGRLNPYVIIIYFTVVIVLSSVIMHPVCQVISLGFSLVFMFIVNNKKIKLKQITYLIFGALFVAFINPLFNHSGSTILFYLKSGNPFTLESVLFGISASLMLCTVICWFLSFNKIVTSEKIVYVFGKILPSVSLFISMILRFIPKMKRQYKEIKFSKMCLGEKFNNKNVFQKIKITFNMISILLTECIENSVETSNSMKSRGFGSGRRTSFSLFYFCNMDFILLTIIFIVTLFICYGLVSKLFYISYFPVIKMSEYNTFNIIFFISYATLCALPSVFEILGEKKWKKLQSKI